MYKRNLVFAAACLGMLLFGIVFLSLGSVNNLLADRFHLDLNGIGTLTVLLPFGILAGSLIFGPIVDRFGYRWLLVVCALLVGAGLEGLAFANSQRLVQFCVFLIGFGGGVLNGATNALTADVSEGQRGARLSLLGVFFGIGALGMPSTLAALSKHFAQMSIVAGIGAFVLLPVVYFLVITFPPPKQQGADRAATGSVSLLKQPVLLLACVALGVQSGMEGMSNDWMTRYFKLAVLAGTPAEEWKPLLALMALTGAMVGVRLVLSGLLARVKSPHVLMVSLALSAAGALVLALSHGYWMALAGPVLIGAGLAACFPVVLSYVGDLYPKQSGTAFSTIFFVALTGNMAINKTFGWLAQQHGIRLYTHTMLVCLGLSVLLLFLLLRHIRKLNSNIVTSNEQRREAMAR
jgi:MFS transporter, FHS family, glucose/mannose:H+ symporter